MSEAPPIPKPHNALKGRGPIFYGAFAGGILILAWQIRKRENSTIQAPASDMVSTSGFDAPSDSAIGSYQGFDSPAAAASGNELSGADVLSFVTDFIGQRNDYQLQEAQMRYDDVADARSYSTAASVTGGGLSDQPIANPAPTVTAATPTVKKGNGCPDAFPKLATGKKAGKGNCYKDEPRCKSHKKQLVHRYQDGHGTVVSANLGKC